MAEDEQEQEQAEAPRGSRHAGREAAVQLLYQMEVSQTFHLVERAIKLYCNFLNPHLTGEARSFAEALATGVAAGLQRIDRLLEQAATNWRVDRMNRVDRAILRLATYELLQGDQAAPVRVVINEAVELAKDFGSPESSSFINGVLSRVAKDLGLVGNP